MYSEWTMSEPITAIVFGAGGRGMYAYGPYATEHLWRALGRDM